MHNDAKNMEKINRLFERGFCPLSLQYTSKHEGKIDFTGFIYERRGQGKICWEGFDYSTNGKIPNEEIISNNESIDDTSKKP